MAGPKAGADMVLSTSSDGLTAGTPLDGAHRRPQRDDRVAMNGEPLPFEHGFPARLVVPGLYGYVSATKWVTELKVTRFSADRGTGRRAAGRRRDPIKTESRIDVPRAGRRRQGRARWPSRGSPGRSIAGSARSRCASTTGRGSRRRLAAEPTVDAWRQWVLMWAATPGTHEIRVRATDATGATQTEQHAPPAPDGSTGWHTVQVDVS